MSTRLYPLYAKGNPQLRVFLPNFWMKLVKPVHDQPPNVVQFQCSMEMTREDIKNYLEKIYSVKTIQVRTRIAMGATRKSPGKGYVVKDDDIKYAYAVLPKGETFTFPDVCPDKLKDERDEYNKTMKTMEDSNRKFLEKNKHRNGVPGWFSI